MTQKFTTPCFIRKNTLELRKKLEELGYKPSMVMPDNERLCIATAVNREYAKYTKTRSHTDGFGENNEKCLKPKGICRFVPDSSICGF